MQFKSRTSAVFLFAVLSLSLLRPLQIFAKTINANAKKSYIVVFKEDNQDVSKKVEALSKKDGFNPNHVYKFALRGFSANLTADKVSKLRQEAGVAYVVEDQAVSIDAKGGKGKPSPSPSPSPTPTPSPTPSPSPSASPTPSPSPSPSPTLSVKVTAPNGGEVLQVGQNYKITWDSSPTIDMVSIGYSFGPGSLNWIAYDIPNSNSFDWNVNIGNTTNTQLKIEVIAYQTGFGSVTDQSDNYFTVLQPTPSPSPTPSPTPTPTPSPSASPSSQVTPTGIARIQAAGPAALGGGWPTTTAAVIDTGIDLNHPDLANNIIANTNCITAGASGDDDNGHGTHVAGTIAAADNQFGVVGVNPIGKVAAVKVLNSNGQGSWSSVICGIDWVTANAATYNIKVANMSLGGSGTSDNNCGNSNSDPLHQALCKSAAVGVTYVVAAGNNASTASSFVPAAYDDAVIAVSALADSDGKAGGTGPSTGYGADDTFASFSNYGPSVDIAAPGVDIYSTYLNDGYTWLSGTSMASPHVAGAALRYVTSHQTATWQQVLAALKAAAEPLNAGHTDPSGKHPEPVVKLNTL